MATAQGSLVWFRQDLRLEDNPALQKAVEHGGPVIPVYIWAPEEEGDWPPGAASKVWLHSSLQSLDKQLRKPLRAAFDERAYWEIGRDGNGTMLPVRNRNRVPQGLIRMPQQACPIRLPAPTPDRARIRRPNRSRPMPEPRPRARAPRRPRKRP